MCFETFGTCLMCGNQSLQFLYRGGLVTEFIREGNTRLRQLDFNQFVAGSATACDHFPIAVRQTFPNLNNLRKFGNDCGVVRRRSLRVLSRQGE